MISRKSAVLTAALLLFVAAPGHAALSPYSQNFEGLVMADPAALSADGWIVYGNVFTLPELTYVYGYGPYPAPNGGTAFCAIDAGQGGPEQGAQQLSVYSDYNNMDHGNSRLIESNVYHEQVIGAEDVGNRWRFQVDAKLGNLVAPSTAQAFLKTLNPAQGYVTTNFLPVEMTAIPTTWGTYSIEFTFDASLVGQLLQFGFNNEATAYISSGVYYDNITWSLVAETGVDDTPRPAALSLAPAAPNPFRLSTRLHWALPADAEADLGVYDVSGRRVANLFHGVAEAGNHSTAWDGTLSEGGLAPIGVYRAVLQTASGRVTRSLVLMR